MILGAKYGTPIDMWSLGCILAELLTGYALFPGEDENDQLACIIELLGMPPQKLLDQSKRAKNFISVKGFPRYCTTQTLEDGNIILSSGTSRQGKERGPPGSRDLKKALKGCDDPLFLNFLCGCLEWDPEVRMTPTAALKHSWFRRRLPRPPHSNQSTNNQINSQTNPPVANCASTGDPSSILSQLTVGINSSIKEEIANCDEANIPKKEVSKTHRNKTTISDLSTNCNELNCSGTTNNNKLDGKNKITEKSKNDIVPNQSMPKKVQSTFNDGMGFNMNSSRANSSSLSTLHLLSSNISNHETNHSTILSNIRPSCSFQQELRTDMQKQNTLDSTDERDSCILTKERDIPNIKNKTNQNS